MSSDSDVDSVSTQATLGRLGQPDNNVVENFLTNYDKLEYKAYKGLANHGAKIVQEELDKRSITHEIYNRGARSFASGTRKIQIRGDMHYLAGLRIALYYPNDFEKVEDLIKERFVQRKPPQDWPARTRSPRRYQGLDADGDDVSGRSSRFPGYFARHYRVKLQPRDVKELPMKGTTLESQLMSLLMHAWSKMHHELIYKPKPGRPLVDKDDERLIDISSGIIIAGEQVIRQIQINLDQKQERRQLLFKNFHDLWGYIERTWVTGPKALSRLSPHKVEWIESLEDERHDIRRLLFTSLTDLNMFNPEEINALVQLTADKYGEKHFIRRISEQLKLPSRACNVTEPRRYKVEVASLSGALRLIRYYIVLICNASRWSKVLTPARSGSWIGYIEYLNLLTRERSGCLYPSGDNFLKFLHPAGPLERPSSGSPKDIVNFWARHSEKRAEDGTRSKPPPASELLGFSPGYFVAIKNWEGDSKQSWISNAQTNEGFGSEWMGFDKLQEYLDRPNAI
ncbi:hypothetical protein BDW74DRAFT_179431 [Aspergillus multicolor]|uniref:uncharacterized protein n=1 Tax=Aspergillus multicolor TaxID=41759 RepID=UPI003CCE12FD